MVKKNLPPGVVDIETLRLVAVAKSINGVYHEYTSKVMAAILKLGDLVLDGHARKLTQVETDDLMHGPFVPADSEGCADIARFARAYPALYERWWVLGPSRIRLLHALPATELHLFLAQELHQVPRRGRPQPLDKIHGIEFFAVVARWPVLGVSEEAKRASYALRAAKLMALADQVRDTPWMVDDEDWPFFRREINAARKRSRGALPLPA